MSLLLLRADARALPLADGCVQTCVTSPPYWGLRDYGVAGQIGLEPTPDAYVANLVQVFREVRRVLRDDGVVFLNLGDSYAAGPMSKRELAGERSGGTLNGRYGHVDNVLNAQRRSPVPVGLKPKDLVGIPWRVAFALQADGWYLRSDIIWAKPNPMPESVTDRPTKAHEYVFLLSKGQWVSRVVQLADLRGERVHFGKHVGTKEPLMGEPVSKFCVRLASTIFDGAQRHHEFSLPPFYAEEWAQLLDSGAGEPVCDHPAIGRLTALSACLLNTHLTTKGFLEQVDRLWLDLRTCDALQVGGIHALLSSPSVNVNADGTVTVNNSGEICEFKFGHGQIVTRRSTTCSYYFDADAVRELNTPNTIARLRYGPIQAKRGEPKNAIRRDCGGDYAEANGRNLRSVWHIATQPYPGAHFATMPEALVRPCILAGSRPGDIVLDPFAGSGTVGRVALKLGRRAICCDLNANYLELADERTQVTLGLPLEGEATA